jgi:hypothetical protein
MQINMTTARLNKLADECHAASMAYIEIVTNAAIDQMQLYGIEPSEENITVPNIAMYAAKRLNVPVESIEPELTKFMVLEGMAGYE